MIPALKSFTRQRFTGSVLPTMGFFAITALAACSQTADKNKEAAGIEKSGLYHLPPAGTISAAEKTALQKGCAAWYDSMLLSKNFNGGMIVAKKGTVVFEAYHGTVQLPGSEPITAQTALHIASVTKTFTAAVILKMMQEGKLSLDDELVKYFPDFNYPGVTIRTLLNHRSGLPNYTHFLERMGWDKKVALNNQDMLDFMIAHKAEMENIARPDTRFSYCNTNYALLALLIEKISGKSYPQYMQEIVFTPLQMKNTFVYTPQDSGKVTPSYHWNGRLMDFEFLDNIYGDKNIYSTPADLLRWDQLLLSDQFLKPATLALAYTGYSNEKAGTRNYGLGWRMNIYPNGKKLVYHNGWWHGNNSSFLRLLDDSATIIILGNKFNRNIYKSNILANLFGDYGFTEEEEEAEPVKVTVIDNKAAPRVKQKQVNKKFADKNKRRGR